MTAVLATAVGVAACSGGSSKASPSATSTTTLPAVVRLSTAPTPLSLPTGSPTAQAVALARATAPATPRTIAGWLTVYDALGIPVVDASGHALGRTPADALAVPYWQVWFAGAGTTATGNLMLTDFVRMLVLPGAIDANAAATALVDDLRADATSSSGSSQLFAHFVADKAKQTAVGLDPLSAANPASKIAIDPGTAMLLGYDFARGELSTLGTRVSKRATSSTTAASASDRPETAPTAVLAAMHMQESGGGGGDCSSIFGNSKELTKTINTIIQNATQGATVPGTDIKVPGLIEQALKAAGWTDDAVKDSKTAAKNISLMASVLDLLIQVEGLNLLGAMEPDPLIRTKHTSNGDPAVISLAIESDPEKALGDLGKDFNSSDWLACATQMILSTLGVSLKLPSEHRIKGAEIQITPKDGFDQWVLIDANDLKLTTNDNGAVEVHVQGRAQKHEIPASAKKFQREFSMGVAAQTEATDLNSIISTFIDGFKFGGGPGAGGGIKGLLDVLKTVHWDLGTQVFRETDWFTGWRVDGDFASYHFTGEACDLDKPFTLKAQSPDGIQGTFTITPIAGPARGGTYSFSGIGGEFPGSPGQLPVKATGHIDLQKPADDDPLPVAQLRLDPGSWTVQAPIIGSLPLGPGGRHLGPTGDVLTLQPDPDVCK